MADDKRGKSEFEQEAERPDNGVIREFWEFLATNKKWWLLPIVIFLLLVGLFIVLTSTPVAPFIYTLF
jgi:Family of unknown function (DUF5989)